MIPTRKMRAWALGVALLAAVSAGAADRKGLRQGLDLSFSGKPHVEKPVQVVETRLPLRPPGRRIRICTYNIQHFVDGIDDWVHKTPHQSKRQAKHAAQLMDRIDPDILLVQEIESAKMAKRLNVSMEEPFPLAWITDFGSDRDRDVSQNIALFSRLPIKGIREIDFEGTSGAGRPPRGVISGFVELGDNHRLLLYGVHLKANIGDRSENYSKRWNALRIIRADVENLQKNYPDYTWETVVTGDMNVDPESRDFGDDPTFQPLIDWTDLWLGRPIEERTTIPPRKGGSGRKYPPQGFDRFILSPALAREPWVGTIPKVVTQGIDIDNAETVPGESAKHISDHYPVVLRIDRSKRRSNKGLLDSVSGEPPGGAGR